MIRRGFYVGLAVLMTLLAVAGFWPTYWGPLLSGTLDLHWLLHLHGLALTTWMLLLIAQTALVYRGRADLHQALGKAVGVGWGLVVLTIGLAAALGRISPAIGTEYEDLRSFLASLMIPVPSIAAFGLLFGAGILYRERPAVHKRLMIVATLVLLDAGTGRLGANLLGVSGLLLLIFLIGIPFALVALAFGYDRWTRGRVHPAYLLGGGVLVLVESRVLLRNTEWWRDVSAGLASALESILLPLM